MAVYEVWATNDPFEWTQLFLETEDRDAAIGKAQKLMDGRKFKYIAIDENGKTIWPDDPEVPLF